MLLEPTAPGGYDAPESVRPGRTIRPYGAYILTGIAFAGERLLAIDTVRGYLLEIDPATDSTTILNPYSVGEFVEATGLAIAEDTLWFAQGNSVYYCDLSEPVPQLFVTLPYPADGVAIWESTVYVTSQKLGYILIFDRRSKREITRFPSPGVGAENLMVWQEELWVSDRTEQTVYCMDRATGEVQFSILTPFSSPTGIAFRPTASGQRGDLYVSYAFEEPYIRDDPNSDEPYELTFRDRTFIHPLHFRHDPEQHYTLSNGFLVEMSYVEEISPLEAVEAKNLEWRIALPAETPRQTVRHVQPIGMPFTEEIQEGQRVAVFKFDTFHAHECRIFGWKALLEVRGIKYNLTFRQVERIPALSMDYQNRYLVDDDELAMENPVIQQAAKVAIGTETNLLRKMLKIRNFVYDRLSYGIKPRIDPPDVVLERGVGSCGEYVGLLLALARLNGIACRTVGRYKCPPYPDRQNIPLEPDFNHVWIEFFIPGFGWVPMESNVDDIIEGGPYPTRFFMGLPWFHAEMSKGISFETLTTPDNSVDVSIGELALNHIRFTILGELPPP
jgi:transglutaminase-like putative cysteine protease